MRKVIVFSILIIIPVLLFAAFWLARPASSAPLNPESPGAGPAWYHPDWHYRRPVMVTNSSTALTNYQVLVKLDSAFDFNHAQTDGYDLRVTASDGTTLLPFWVESWNNTGTKAWVWVKVPTLPASGSTILYLYYGNTSATSASDGMNTFEAYDGYENYAAGQSPWGNYTDNPGEWPRYANHPVLTGTAGTWDSGGATFASVISDTIAGQYRMYYHGWGGAGCSSTCIGLATSPDGLTWVKYGTTPVMTPTLSWDANGVRVPIVWIEGGTYHMIYTGNQSGYGNRVGYASSTDGIRWNKYANPVFYDDTSSSSWSYHSVQNWGVIKVGSEYLMWYGNSGALRRAGIATTTVLTSTWTAYIGNPIFTSPGSTTLYGTTYYTYSQFSPFTFTDGNYYYALVPSYTGVGDYARYYLYRHSTPYFPAASRALVRVVHTVGASGQWDAQDSDTPFVFTTGITRTVSSSDQLRAYYAGARGSINIWAEGLLTDVDIDAATDDAGLPVGVTWGNLSPISVTVVITTMRQGSNSLQIVDPRNNVSPSSTGYFTPVETGTIGAWLRRNNTTAGDLDIYLYGVTGSTPYLAAVVGLGRNQQFHYWNRNPGVPPGGYGSGFHDTGVYWATNTWYLLMMEFDAATDRYNFVVYDQTLEELYRLNNIAFGYSVTTLYDAMFNTSSVFVGNGYADDFRLRKYVSPEPTISVRPYSDIQETQSIAGTGDRYFSLVGITVTVQTQGSLTSLQVVRYEHDHPNGTFYSAGNEVYGTKTGRYWEINPNNPGYTVNLTLPHNSVPEDKDKVCRWTGTSTIWDCAANGYDAVQGTIWRDGITQLSEWATGNNVGPTVVGLKDMTATSGGDKIMPAILAASLLILLAVGVFWRLRVRSHP